MHTIELTHSFDAAHRVVGHLDERGGAGKCSRLHGHTYTVKFQVSCEILDGTGFVVDFARLKALANEWDHRTLLWENDPLVIVGALAIFKSDAEREIAAGREVLDSKAAGVVRLPFNPTSENMSAYLADAALALDPGRITHTLVELSETPKSKALARSSIYDNMQAARMAGAA